MRCSKNKHLLALRNQTLYHEIILCTGSNIDPAVGSSGRRYTPANQNGDSGQGNCDSGKEINESYGFVSTGE